MSVGDVADPTEAVAQFLKEHFGEAVFRPEMPEIKDPELPLDAVVVMPGGGGSLMAGNRLPVIDSIVDILAYGATRLSADNLARDVQNLLRELEMAKVECPEADGEVLLFWARGTSGLNPRMESQVAWPYTEASYQILHSELVL